MRPGIHPVMHRVTVVLRNGASIDVLSTVPRSAPYFLREVGPLRCDMHDRAQWPCRRMLPYSGSRLTGRWHGICRCAPRG